MPTTHIVRQGECLSSIAYHYKLASWRAIYDDPHNADFRQQRPNPNLICPGDRLYIPDLTPREVTIPTGQRHVFVLDIAPAYASICVQDAAKEPIVDAPYELILGALTLEGTTDGKGWVRCEIPAWAETGTLKVWMTAEGDDDDAVEWPIMFGHLDPIDTTSGVKGRLNNLGYSCGPVNDQEDERYDAAVRRFQHEHELAVDGIVGPKTGSALSKAHRV
jgi:N-acetylmuramoyl-L-alanine amidase